MELLVVIAVIAILAAIVLVALSDARQRAWEARGLQFSQNIRTTLATDLVGEWSFDDSSNPGRDDSGNNNNGTVYGATWTDKGKVRGDLDFNGNGSYVEFPRNHQIGYSDFTVSFWIKTKNNPPESDGIDIGGIIGQGITHGVQIYLTYSYVCVRVWNGSDYSEWSHCTKTKIADNNWYHLVYNAKRNSKGEFYINGKLDNDFDISRRANEDIIIMPRLGRNTWLNTDTMKQSLFGFIDEVQIYKRSLTSQEVQQLYVEGLPRHLADR